MKISVITVCYNADTTIQKCLDSVASQNHKYYEHLIIDGGSNDSTLDIIKKHKNPNIALISEKDKGIYNAMNKGLRHASGDIIHFLNADDCYTYNDVFFDVWSAFNLGSKVVLSDINYGTLKDNIWRSTKPSMKKIKLGWHPPHPGFFCKTEFYREFGGFDEKLLISADFDIMMKIIMKYINYVTCLNRVTTLMNPNGESSSFKSILIGNINVGHSAKKNGITKFPIIYILLRLIPKITRKLKSYRY